MGKAVVKGQVGVPGEYFLKMAAHDYNDHREALPREFYQNSIDAGAKSIRVMFKNAEQSITVEDDGCGMTREVLLEKLLVLGGSHKKGGSVGAFGKAKELLFFSWMRYEIETQDWLVKGVGAQYELHKLSYCKEGTRCTIWIEDKSLFNDLTAYFKQIARRMETSCEISVNDQVIECDVKRGDVVKDLGWAKLYLDKETRRSWEMKVRVQGIWMFSRWIGEFPGQLVMELEHSSLEMLTSNRDGLKAKYHTEMDAEVRKIIVDRKTALEPPKPTLKRELVKGTGKVKVPEQKVLDALSADSVRNLKWSDTVAALKDALDAIPPDIIDARMEVMKKHVSPYETLYDYVDRLQFMGYKPDFVLKYTSDQQREVDKFMKSKTASDLANIWSEILKQVMMDNGMLKEFTAGFTFNPNRLAEIEHQGGDEIRLYLNPLKLGTLTGLQGKPLSDRFRLMLDMQERAIHEVTHLDREYHDEDFVIEMDRVRANTWKSYTVYSRIANWGRTWKKN